MRKRIGSLFTAAALAVTALPLALLTATATPAAAVTTGITATPDNWWNNVIAYPDRAADAAHNFTAIVGTNDSVEGTGGVNFDVIAGPSLAIGDTPCVQGAAPADESYACTYASPGVEGIDTIRVYADLNGNMAFNAGSEPSTTITKGWSNPADSLTVLPATNSGTGGTCLVYTVTVEDDGGRPAPNAPVDVTVSPSGTTTHVDNPNLTFCDPREANGPAGVGSMGPGDAFLNNVEGVTPNEVAIPAGAITAQTTTAFTPGPQVPPVVCDDTDQTAPDSPECQIHGQFQTNPFGILTFGVTSDPAIVAPIDGAGTYDIEVFLDTTAADNIQVAGEPAVTVTATFTPGGANAADEVIVTPAATANIGVSAAGPGGVEDGTGVPGAPSAGTIQNPQHVFTVQVNDASGDPIPNITTLMYEVVGVNSTQADPPAPLTCSPTDQTGRATCAYPDMPGGVGVDNITVWVDQTSGVNTTNVLDATEPRDTQVKTWTNPAQNQATFGAQLLLECGATNEIPVAGQLLLCANELSDATETFTARVVTPAGQFLPNVRVQFVYDGSGNVLTADAEDTTEGAILQPADQLSCITDANGTCSINVTQTNPRHGDAVIMHAYMWVDGTVPGGVTVPDYVAFGTVDPNVCVGCTNPDLLVKGWFAETDEEGSTIPLATVLTPAIATNTTGDSHTVNGRVIDVLGNGVAGVPVDFSMDLTGLSPAGTPSRNELFNRTLAGPPLNYTGSDKLTDASGNFSWTYADDPALVNTVTGTNQYDEINAFIDTDSDDAADAFNILPVPFVSSVLKKWVLGADNAQLLGIDVSGPFVSPANPCNITVGNDGSGFSIAQGDVQDHNTNSTTVASNVVCALVANDQGEPLAGVPVTFTLSGVGSFQDPFTFEEVTSPQVVLTNNQGYAIIRVHSDETGNQTITASANGQSDNGQIRYLSNPANARFITVTPASRTTETGTNQGVTATVTDVFGNPVPLTPVLFSRTGVGVATSGDDPQILLTDLNGTATKTYTSAVEGIMTVEASIDPAVVIVPNDCIQLAGQGPNSTPDTPAGNCTDTSVITWDESGAPGEGPGTPPVTPGTDGYTLVASDGGIFNFNTPFFGSLGNLRLVAPIVAAFPTASGNGYYLIASDGGVFAFGDAVFRGSTGNLRLVSPVVGGALTATGNGYYLVAADGGVFAFGDAVFRGSTGNIRLNRPIVAMFLTASGNGYYLIASDGGVFAFGDAVFRGSTGNIRLNLPVVNAILSATGNGYYLVASDGGVFAFGDAVFRGSTGNIRLNSPIVDMELTAAGTGYWLIARDGGVFAFNAPFRGSLGNLTLNAPIVGSFAL